jgi:hypothetical protein
MAIRETAYEAALQRITDQEARITRQEQLIRALAKAERPTEKAEELLAVMRATLNTLRLSLGHIPGSN